MNADVIIIGSGPAGVSAAFPLVQKGLSVLMLDVGLETTMSSPSGNFLTNRFTDQQQSRWMLGDDNYAVRSDQLISPKLKVPALSYVFENFLVENKIISNDFVGLGSLAKGGLSNAWGAGVAKFSPAELKQFGDDSANWNIHYKNVFQRMGISGASDDDLRNYFGVDDDADTAIEMDYLNSYIFDRYLNKKKSIVPNNFKLGRSRVAVLNTDQGERQKCNLSGNCVWGCNRGSIYSAQYDLKKLKNYKNFSYKDGCVVEEIFEENTLDQSITGVNVRNIDGSKVRFVGKKLVVATGTLASTGFALRYLKMEESISFLSSPTAAFILWVYPKFGSAIKNGFGLGQLSYRVEAKNITGFGSTFSPVGIPASEFVKHIPLSRSGAIDLWRHLMSSCLVANLFLPGHLTKCSAKLNNKGELELSGNYTNESHDVFAGMKKLLAKNFLSLNAWMLPGSFTLGKPGSDIHYAGSLPPSKEFKIGCTSPKGLLYGSKNIYIVDGSVLPILPEKSHTATIMANADRIGSSLVDLFNFR